METLLFVAGLLMISATLDSNDNIKNNFAQSPICQASKKCMIENNTLSKDSPMIYILNQDLKKEGR